MFYRYLLQQLREKREQRLTEKPDGRPSTPRGRKHAGYGSHPDLSHQKTSQDGRRSPYLTSLSQSKVFSSLSKLPLPRENSRKARPKKHQDGYRSGINPNYLRPLTPQVLPTSNSAHNFECAERREEYGKRMRQRPASAMDFTYNLPDQQDDYLEMLAHQAGITISPPHSSSSDRSRREMQQSLHKLLVETGNQPDEYSDPDHDGNDDPVSSYHKQFLTTKERILKNRSSHPLPGENLQDDFGIYGDDDDEDDDNDLDDTEVKPMKLLQDSHRPKIMVPKWRQNAAPKSSGYNSNISGVNRKTPPTSGTPTEASLAVSLAQSLFDAPKQATLPRDNKSSRDMTRMSFDGTTELKPKKGSLKVKNSQSQMESAQEMTRNNEIRDGKLSVSVTKSLSFDSAPNRPKHLPLQNQQALQNQQSHSGPLVNKALSPTMDMSSQQVTNNPDSDSKRNSVTKLGDVIAYTADCLEKSELKTMQTGDDVSDNEEENSSQRMLPDRDLSKMTKSDIMASYNMKVSSVDTVTSPVLSSDESDEDRDEICEDMNEQQGNPKTNKLVFYFQNRDKINEDTMKKLSPDSNSKIPTFITMNKTSTPIHEHKPLHNDSNAVPKTSYGPLTGKPKVQGRMLRDEISHVGNVKENGDLVAGKVSCGDEDLNPDNDKQEGATKERVLKAVDKLRLSFERKKLQSEERRQTIAQNPPPRNATSPTSMIPIQKHFNDITKVPKSQDSRPLTLRTFASPSQTNQSGDELESPYGFDMNEQKQGLYKKVSQPKYQQESSASARHIQKLERATSPSTRATSPSNLTNTSDKFKQQTEPTMNYIRPPSKGPFNVQRNSAEGSMIPQRSKSPIRASMERERPKSTTDFMNAKLESKEETNLKSAMRDTKIPVLKKASSGPISKSSEDLSKIKKKSPFKELKNLFGRKK